MKFYSMIFRLKNSNVFKYTHPFSVRQTLPCFGIIFIKTINTQGNQRKGKLTVVRRKIDCQQLIVEDLETKDASTVMKQFNLENKSLFGNIFQTFTKKKVKRQYARKPTVIYNEPCIPIQDLKLNIQSSLSSANEHTNINSLPQKILDIIPDFPLMDKVEENEIEKITHQSNCLKQYLEKLNSNKLPSVTSILEATMPSERITVLAKWKESMIKKLGKDGFETYQKDLLFNGSGLHQCITGYLTKQPELESKILPGNVGHWDSLKTVLPNLKEVRLLEEHVNHPFLCYKGVIDCLAEYKDHFVVIDWKTSSKPKLSVKSTYDAPLQIAAYVGALNFDPKFKYIVNKGLIVIAYDNGTPATVHFLEGPELLNHWKEWLHRLKCYWEKIQSSQK